MSALFVRNDLPYGTERSFSGLRLAYALAKREGVAVGFFAGGTPWAARTPGQPGASSRPDGHYHLERGFRSCRTAAAFGESALDCFLVGEGAVSTHGLALVQDRRLTAALRFRYRTHCRRRAAGGVVS